MAHYPIGRLIAEMRKRQELSQEKLAEGICSTSTLSKIENEAQMPSRKVYEALLQRMGLSRRYCSDFISKADIRRSELEILIEQLIRESRYEDALKALAEYIVCDMPSAGKDLSLEEQFERYVVQLGLQSKRLKNGDCGQVDACIISAKRVEQVLRCLIGEGKRSNLEKQTMLSHLELQYALCQLAVLADVKDSDSDKALELYELAVRQTMPGMSPQSLSSAILLTSEEIRILYHIAVIYYEKGECALAKSILFILKEYMDDKYIDQEEKANCYPAIMHRLSQWMGNDGRTDRQLEFCESGIRMCLQHGRLFMLPQLLTVKGNALSACGQNALAESILMQAYLIFELIGESAETEQLKNRTSGLLGIDLTAEENFPGMK